MAKERAFVVGDTVKLKSGGPLMTVTAFVGDQTVTCSWFVAGGVQTGNFPEDALVKPPEGPSSRGPGPPKEWNWT